MNNLLLAMLLFVSATFVWFNRYSVVRQTRIANETLNARLAETQTALDAARALCVADEKRLAESRSTAQGVRTELTQLSSEAREVISLPDVSAEGTWPGTRDYFYLPKHFLGGLGYGLFRADGQLSVEAARLLE